MLAEGASFNAITRRLQTTTPTIMRWKQRFLEFGPDGLDTCHPGQKATVLTPALRARILSATGKKPSDGSTHCSCRELAMTLGLSRDAVHRVWKEAGLKPHRLERSLASDDPELESKEADILGLYLNPPQHGAPRSSPQDCKNRQLYEFGLCLHLSILHLRSISTFTRPAIRQMSEMTVVLSVRTLRQKIPTLTPQEMRCKGGQRKRSLTTEPVSDWLRAPGSVEVASAASASQDAGARRCSCPPMHRYRLTRYGAQPGS